MPEPRRARPVSRARWAAAALAKRRTRGFAVPELGRARQDHLDEVPRRRLAPDRRHRMERIRGAGKHHHPVVPRPDPHPPAARAVQDELAALHLRFVGVAEIDEQGDGAAAVIEVGEPLVTRPALHDIDPYPELVRRGLVPGQPRQLLLGAGLQIGHITGAREIDPRLGRENRVELAERMIDETLALKRPEEAAPSLVPGDQPIIGRIAPEQGKAGRTGIFRARRKRLPQSFVKIPLEPVVGHHVREGPGPDGLFPAPLQLAPHPGSNSSPAASPLSGGRAAANRDSPPTLTLCAAACICALSEASCSVNWPYGPAPSRDFPKVSLFTRVARTRRVSARHSGCAARRTFK